MLKFTETINHGSHLILLPIGSAPVSAVLGSLDIAVSIAVAIIIVVTVETVPVGLVQEWRFEGPLAALNKLVPHHCRIIRAEAGSKCSLLEIPRRGGYSRGLTDCKDRGACIGCTPDGPTQGDCEKLPRFEALGSDRVTSSDKTGTLTKNAISSVRGRSYHARRPFWLFAHTLDIPCDTSCKKTLEVGGIRSDAFRNNEGVNVGQSTDVTMLNVSAKFGVKDERRNFTHTHEHLSVPKPNTWRSLANTAPHAILVMYATLKAPSTPSSHSANFITSPTTLLLPSNQRFAR
ncbi:High affinity Ca2+/Mn2+ P-type ATPase-like protein [Ceratobasidium sp. 428]|nr:High affinity Ca2+/Mn2+ P-type ATPase-like protein [Ceratobasidium sp. 428]